MQAAAGLFVQAALAVDASPTLERAHLPARNVKSRTGELDP
jgi:hypothetical protein